MCDFVYSWPFHDTQEKAPAVALLVYRAGLSPHTTPHSNPQTDKQTLQNTLRLSEQWLLLSPRLRRSRQRWNVQTREQPSKDAAPLYFVQQSNLKAHACIASHACSLIVNSTWKNNLKGTNTILNSLKKRHTHEY